MEKIPPQENNKKSEKEIFFERYPLPENHKDKADIVLELKNIKNSFLERKNPEEGKKNYNDLYEFSIGIRNKYKNIFQYYLYHMLIGSSIDEKRAPTEFDLPEEDSIEKYLRSKNI